MKREKFYAVRQGRDAPMICTDWEECKSKITRFPGAEFKSFVSRQQAEEWLAARELVRPKQIISTDIPPPLPPPDPNANQIQLSPEQQHVLRLVREGRNVFYTGSAGTGKSVLLREIIRQLRSMPSDCLAITASTGIAAVNIGGTTLHSWAGIGLGQDDADKLAGKFKNQSIYGPVVDRWQAVKTLIIDEISMIDGRLFDMLERLARLMRKNYHPFGGIQLILSGDFCQLPPVPGRDKQGSQVPATFAFEAHSWNFCMTQQITLSRVFRQKDQGFVDMLNALRFGQTDTKINNIFRQLSRSVTYSDNIEPTELFPTRAEVEYANKTRLDQLSGRTFTYVAQDIEGIDSLGKRVTVVQRDRLLDRLVAPKQLTLKVGAQVMLIKNLEQGVLVNGSLGKVIDFRNAPDDGDYASPGIVRHSDFSWPVVQFTNEKVEVCTPERFSVENAKGEMEACRHQVPLILAYALSVHKSQGQTLERVKIDLKRTFEKGQAYVALSRATNMEHLQVLNYDPGKILAHPRVLQWYADKVNNELDDEWDQFDI